ncbi:hypothetical protein [Arthrobacter sp. H35-D1]|uniref:hypothetical protein n=1 Tax=Arthrobacter sp. H35-D1 TaxID=3046202 RepID=UPI0024BBB704|nr:hypothetical protein [Arthrobacter sp. H35-D1]MDJ0314577.1 hypothetical protein [Arthrobacter sp. H35-D1]
MYPPPAGRELTTEQRRELDDTFLSSDPFGYFTARIGMLLQWEEINSINNASDTESSDAGAHKPHAGKSRAQFSSFLGQPVDFLPRVTERTVTTQIATDAYSLRHHAAESLTRLTAALLTHSEDAELCVWEALSMGPNQLDLIVGQIGEAFSAKESPMTFGRLVLIEHDLQKGMTEVLASACNVFADWLQFAVDLLMGHELQLNAAHNKVKHGPAVRARDDLKISFSTSPPNTDGSISLSALTGPDVVNIFDRPVMEVLAQGPKVQGHKQGLELTQLRVDIPAILAEAYMIAWTHGAIFHVAAAQHFTGRCDFPEHLNVPAHPGYPTGGPHPEHIAAKAPIGMRFPLTTPPGGGAALRPAGIAFRDMFIPLSFTGTAMGNIRVVEDEETEV